MVFFKLLAKLVLGVVVFATPIAVYIAAPFSAAWNIREAVTGNDTVFLARKVQWASVRETMRDSMLRTALDLPYPDDVETSAPAPQPRRGIFARIKARVKGYASRRVVDKMVTSYITADGLPKLYKARRTMREINGEYRDPEDALERFKGVWSRITRAEFRSPTEFEIELSDQFSADRSYQAVLELKRAEWILTELRIKSRGPATVASVR